MSGRADKIGNRERIKQRLTTTPIKSSQLAERLGVNKSTVANLLLEMERAGEAKRVEEEGTKALGWVLPNGR